MTDKEKLYQLRKMLEEELKSVKDANFTLAMNGARMGYQDTKFLEKAIELIKGS